MDHSMSATAHTETGVTPSHQLEFKFNREETVGALTSGAINLANIAENASQVLGKLSELLKTGHETGSSYSAHHERMNGLWRELSDARYGKGNVEHVNSKIAQTRSEFVCERADDTARKFVELDRVLGAVIEIVDTGPGAQRSVDRLQDLRREFQKHGSQAAEAFSAIMESLPTAKDSGHELGNRLANVEENAWERPTWGIFRSVTAEVAETLQAQVSKTYESAFDNIGGPFGSSVVDRFKENRALYSDNHLSGLVHRFAQSETTIRGLDDKPMATLAVLRSWAADIVGRTAPQTGDVSYLLRSLDSGPGKDFCYRSSCEALAHFGWQTNQAFDKTNGEGTGANTVLDTVLAARSACVTRLTREVTAMFSEPENHHGGWEDPHQPLSALTSFGCQGLSAAIGLARQNPWRKEFVNEVLESLRAVADPRPSGNHQYLDSLESNQPSSPASRIRAEGVALCMQHIDTESMRHQALWTLIRLAPEDSLVRSKVREILSSDTGCHEVRLVKDYAKYLELAPEEIEAAEARSRAEVMP